MKSVMTGPKAASTVNGVGGIAAPFPDRPTREHQRPDDFKVFPLMQRAIVRGRKSYIRELLEQSELVAATANARKPGGGKQSSSFLDALGQLPGGRRSSRFGGGNHLPQHPLQNIV